MRLRRYAVAGAALVLGVIGACPGSAWSGEPLPASLDDAPVTFRDVLQSIHRRAAATSWSDWNITLDGPQRKARLAWLAKDFRAPAFRQADRVDEAHLFRRSSQDLLDLGLWVLHFPKCKQLKDVRAAMLKTGRSNFVLPVLTVFRTVARGRELIFVFSETPLHPTVDSLWKNLPEVVGGEMPCTAGSR
jgi:hypothetical protein